ncbi:thiolase family protein [Variovorax sp. J22R24]|uniref:thiolase family protein n=1 Tax=Variovorax gracilis TaxID=3053502 RepID=UPI002578EB43|nr:thiolase family protein [Variovorax sp. J22R24]MDM0106579.1 thiolase family protein [Variovorax sp. J22R24]
MPKSLKNKFAVVGVGNTAYGSFPEKSDYGLGADAFKLALEDSGLQKAQIDGLLCCRVPYYAQMGAVLGIDPRWTVTLPGHGRMSGMGIIEGMMALECGAADYVALIYTNIGRSRRMNYGGEDMAGIWDPWGMTSPGAAHALMFQMHMAQYGTTTRQLAEVSVAFREHAILNPNAVMRHPITIDDHERSRRIVEPLGLLDYCLVNDGAVCMILTTKERAQDLKKPPVYISGYGAQDAFSRSSISNFDENFWYEETRSAGQQAYEMAGVSNSDIDGLMAYDNFSPTVLFSLEGLGFCERGDSGSFVEGGSLRLGSRLPTNTDGGHLSNSYMQGWALNVEAVRQVRGECGERQIPDCNVVQYIQACPCTRSIIYTRG